MAKETTMRDDEDPPELDELIEAIRSAEAAFVGARRPRRIL